MAIPLKDIKNVCDPYDDAIAYGLAKHNHLPFNEALKETLYGLIVYRQLINKANVYFVKSEKLWRNENELKYQYVSRSSEEFRKLYLSDFELAMNAFRLFVEKNREGKIETGIVNFNFSDTVLKLKDLEDAYNKGLIFKDVPSIDEFSKEMEILDAIRMHFSTHIKNELAGEVVDPVLSLLDQRGEKRLIIDSESLVGTTKFFNTGRFDIDSGFCNRNIEKVMVSPGDHSFSFSEIFETSDITENTIKF